MGASLKSQDLPRGRLMAPDAAAPRAAADPRDSYVAAVAHELRTPISGMLALADLVLQGDLPDDARTKLEAIRAAARHLEAVSTDLLDLVRVKSGSMPLEPAPLDLAALVAEIVPPHAALAARGGATIAVELGAGLPPLHADRRRLREIIDNLLSNAVKVSRDGTIRLALAYRPREEDAAGLLSVTVADCGPGFPPGEAEMLFAPFVQGRHASGGSGLGLSLVKAYAEAMGGRAFARNGAAGGAVVGVELALDPAEPAHAAAPAAVPDPVPAAAPAVLRVLVADDHAPNRIVLGAILDQFGHRHQAVGDGREALEAVRAGHFDLVLMDATMPHLDGLAAVRAIRALPGRAGRTPVIGVTARAYAHEVETFLEAGADAVVTKPISVHAMWNAIAEVVGRRDAPG